VSHLVVGTTKLEREDGLQVLTLEEDLALQAVGKVDSMCEGRFFDDIVDSGCEDEAEVLEIVSHVFSIAIDRVSTYIWVARRQEELSGDLCLFGLGL
jgi:hypothetical protein